MTLCQDKSQPHLFPLVSTMQIAATTSQKLNFSYVPKMEVYVDLKLTEYVMQDQ